MSIDLSQELEAGKPRELGQSRPIAILGSEDRETEAKFGRVELSTRAANNISRLSLMYIENEIGGFLVGWDEGGVRHIADSLVYIPDDPQVGQFKIIEGESQMLWAMERMKENPAYEGHKLQVLGWWHTHPPEMRAADGSIIPAFAPIPTGQMLEGRSASGDLGVTEYYSRRFGKPQETLIVQTTRSNQPIDVALWRWDDTEGAEAAHYQSGVRITTDNPSHDDNEVRNITYWRLPDGGRKVYNLHVRDEDIIKVDTPEEQIIDLTQADLRQGEGANLPEITITSEELGPEEAVVNITILDESNQQQEVVIDLRDLYKPGIKGKLTHTLDRGKTWLTKNTQALRELKNQLQTFLSTGSWDALPDVRIEIEEALREIERLEEAEKISEKIKILD